MAIRHRNRRVAVEPIGWFFEGVAGDALDGAGGVEVFPALKGRVAAV